MPKSVIRIQGKRTRGWQVRVQWQGHQLPTRLFSDSVWGGNRKALKAALAHRDALEQACQKPRTEHCVQSLFQRNASGYPGIREGLRREYGKGREPKAHRVFYVTYPRSPGIVATTTVSIEKWGYVGALERALALRKEKMQSYYC